MKLKIGINQWSNLNHGAKLCYSVILWYIFAAVLTGFFHISKSIVYFGDLLNIWLFSCALYRNGAKIKKNNTVLAFVLIFVLEAIVSGIVNIESPILLLWGMRQNFRFFIFFFSCTVFLRRIDYEFLFRIIKVLFWVSLPLCFYEARMVSYPSGAIVGDYVGGIYYGIQGVNAPLNIVLIIHSTKTLIEFYKNRIDFSHLLLTIGSALAMAAFSELKIYLVEVVIITVFVMLYNGASLKSVILILIGIFAASIVVQAFVSINGNGRSYYTKEYLSFSGILENALRSSGYDGNGDLNRFFAVQTLINKFFNKDALGVLLGMGLGNAEYSMGYSFLTSKFYSSYSWLHYQYFSISFVFIETGLLGLTLYFGIFVSALIQGPKCIYEQEHRIFYCIMVLMMIIMIFYNPSLRNEQCGFILYLILAMPFVHDDSQIKRSEEK